MASFFLLRNFYYDISLFVLCLNALIFFNITLEKVHYENSTKTIYLKTVSAIVDLGSHNQNFLQVNLPGRRRRRYRPENFN